MGSIVQHIGETKKAHNGQMMTVIEYIDGKHITVKFEDGTIVKARYDAFKSGYIKNPNLIQTTNPSVTARQNAHIGETIADKNNNMITIVDWYDQNHVLVRFWNNIEQVITYSEFKSGCAKNPNTFLSLENENIYGDTMKIIAFRSARDIDVVFENKAVVVGTNMYRFRNGQIQKPLSSERIGETKKACNGLSMTIIKYTNSNNIVVEFEDGYKTKTTYKMFKDGTVKNPNVNSSPLIGRQNESLNGMMMTIIDSEGTIAGKSKVYTVQFEDGAIVKIKNLRQFYNGTVRHPNMKESWWEVKGKHHIGETRLSNVGLIATIIKYKSSKDITIQYEDGTIEKTNYTKFRLQKNLLHPAFDINKKHIFVYKNLKCKCMYSGNNEAYFACKCEKCGYDEILSANEMLQTHICDPEDIKAQQQKENLL